MNFIIVTNGITTTKFSPECISQDVHDHIQGEDDISLRDDEANGGKSVLMQEKQVGLKSYTHF